MVDLSEVTMTLTVNLGQIDDTIRNISNYEKGTIIDLGVPAGAKCPVLLNDTKMGTVEIMVFERNLAARFKTIGGE